MTPLQPYRETSSAELEAYRGYLLMLARMHSHAVDCGKMDLSGVVQQTLIEAHQSLADGKAGSIANQPAWLRRILLNNLRDELRRVQAGVRDCRRERSLEALLDDSSARMEAWLAAEQSSPSARAIRNEDFRRLADAVSRLPPFQREAVELHHFGGVPVAEVARQMGRTEAAVGSLLLRGVKRLRELMQPKENGR